MLGSAMPLNPTRALRVGVCASMLAPATDPCGIESVEAAAALGFDYIELSLAHLAALERSRFDELVARVAGSGLGCEACNNFFPPAGRLTGPAADPALALEYAAAALERAARVGVEIVVLGSSGAKNVPDRFSLAEARRQLLALLAELGPIAQRHAITIALEPISRPEANFIILAAEALELVRELDHPSIQLLVDYYHLATEREDPDVIRSAGPALRHLHFARAADRGFPTAWEDGFAGFFRAVADTGYDGRLSIEAYTREFGRDARAALRLVRAGAAEVIS